MKNKKKHPFRLSPTHRIISPSGEDAIGAVGQDARVQRHRVDRVVRKWERLLHSDNGQIVQTRSGIVLRMSVDLDGTSGKSTVTRIEQVQVAGDDSNEIRIGHIVGLRLQHALARRENVVRVDDNSDAGGADWCFDEELKKTINTFKLLLIFSYFSTKASGNYFLFSIAFILITETKTMSSSLSICKPNISKI